VVLDYREYVRLKEIEQDTEDYRSAIRVKEKNEKWTTHKTLKKILACKTISVGDINSFRSHFKATTS
jgi:hypothetical protein